MTWPIKSYLTCHEVTFKRFRKTIEKFGTCFIPHHGGRIKIDRISKTTCQVLIAKDFVSIEDCNNLFDK